MNSPLLHPSEHAQVIKRKTYRAILELSARHPLLNASDIALMTGAREQWVRRIMKSDAFMAQRAQLVEELHGPRLREIQAKMEETTSLLLDAIAKRIANPDASVSEDTLLKAAALLLDRVLPQKGAPPVNPGNPQPSQNVTMIFPGVSNEDIRAARDKALSHGRTITLEPQAQIEARIHVDEDGIPTPARIRSNEGVD